MSAQTSAASWKPRSRAILHSFPDLRNYAQTFVKHAETNAKSILMTIASVVRKPA
ncbi:hypothetical protein SD77_2616 [Bacillus badius]|uniref:Uncharacterized protein n=1 Tax=Bacillus badius TaxID=1455 RepID=A0ABR5AR65_BACBA|nr:hypothetical protein SD78_1070 [Bacillus badius]KIL76831.1 hypothetical protein SD77_2616 [Bacillus badius]